MPDTWTVELYQVNGAIVVASAPVKRWFFNRVLNGPGAFEATLNIADTGVTEANYASGAREIVVKRNATKEWGGYLTHISVQTPQPGVELTIRGEGYAGRLRRRLVMSDLIYADVNQQTIAWNLINHTQTQSSGDLGFTLGSHTGSNITRSRDYCAMDRPNIGSAIDELAQQLDGFDYEVSPTKAFNTWQKRKEVSTSEVFDGANVIEGGYEIDASGLASMVVFQGEDDCNPPFGSVSDATSLSTYGLLQSSLNTGTTSWNDSLNFARNELWMSRQPRRVANITWDSANDPAWTDLQLGSLVTYTAARGFATFSKTMRVVTIGASFDPGFRPRYMVTLDDDVTDLA